MVPEKLENQKEKHRDSVDIRDNNTNQPDNTTVQTNPAQDPKTQNHLIDLNDFDRMFAELSNKDDKAPKSFVTRIVDNKATKQHNPPQDNPKDRKDNTSKERSRERYHKDERQQRRSPDRYHRDHDRKDNRERDRELRSRENNRNQYEKPEKREDSRRRSNEKNYRDHHHPDRSYNKNKYEDNKGYVSRDQNPLIEKPPHRENYRSDKKGYAPNDRNSSIEKPHHRENYKSDYNNPRRDRNEEASYDYKYKSKTDYAEKDRSHDNRTPRDDYNKRSNQGKSDSRNRSRSNEHRKPSHNDKPVAHSSHHVDQRKISISNDKIKSEMNDQDRDAILVTKPNQEEEQKVSTPIVPMRSDILSRIKKKSDK